MNKAKKYYEKALAITIEIGDRDGEATAYINLGGVLHSLDEYKKAEEYYEKALAITIEIGDRHGEATAYRELGTVFLYLAEYDKYLVLLVNMTKLKNITRKRLKSQLKLVTNQQKQGLMENSDPCHDVVVNIPRLKKISGKHLNWQVTLESAV